MAHNNDDIKHSLELIESYAGDLNSNTHIMSEDANIQKDSEFEIKKDDNETDMVSVYGKTSHYKYGTYPTRDEAEQRVENLKNYKNTDDMKESEEDIEHEEDVDKDEYLDDNEEVINEEYSVVPHNSGYKVMKESTEKCYGFHVDENVANMHAKSLNSR